MMFYQADWICPATSPPIPNGVLVVENGRIAELVHSKTLPESAKRFVYPGCAIVPGFVNAHAHIELTIFAGLLEGLSFADWIAKLTRMKYQMSTRDDLKVSARLGAIQMLQAGITTVGEVMDVGTGWEAIKEFGLQGVAYQEVFGPSIEASTEALARLRHKVARSRLQETETQRIGVSPHAPYTVSYNLYEGVRDYARREGLLMTAHIAESREETSFVRDGSGPFAESHRKRNIEVVARNCSPLTYLNRLGMLGPDMLLIHAVETDASDLDSIRDTGSPVVHCPRSNAKLGHRIAPVCDMRRRNVTVALGTDSIASNDGIDMFAEMRAVVLQQRLGFDEVFRMATIEGARALGLSNHLGSLESGKSADFTVISLHKDPDHPIRDIIQSAQCCDVRATFVGGREAVVDDREIRSQIDRVQRRLTAEGLQNS
jgi:cytosine/adenosine deaminase-related metal-dependent hydrolase